MAAQLRTLAETDVREIIPQEQLLQALQTPPFIHVPGTFNTRDLGLLTSTSPRIRSGFLYRTGGLDLLGASPDGQALLRDKFGVRRIFDLRSKEEHAARPDPEIEGVEGIWLGSEKAAKADPAAFVDGGGEKGCVAMYMEVLTLYKDIFREVLRSVRDRPDEGIMFHCTAGRDRTGVLAGLLESLAGYDPEIVQTDYLLTRIGYEPMREHLLKFALRGAGVDANGGVDMAPLYALPGFYNLVSLRASCWDAFIEAVGDEYDGFDGYATKLLGFSEDDLARIKRNLVESQ